MMAVLKALQKDLPPEYPYLMTIADLPAPVNLKLNMRGDPHALGEEVPRGFPAILAGTGGEPRLSRRGADAWSWLRPSFAIRYRRG